MPATTLVLVDGFAVIYRAFYAIRNLSTADGVPTNALFGFVRMLQQLKQEWRPTHWAVVFDGGLPKRRMDLLPSYKAQRPSMPDPLRAQLPLIEEYLDCAGIPQLRVEGEEADDVLATLASPSWCAAERVLVASSDKDLFQIVDGRTCLVGVSGKIEVMDPAGVRRKTGVFVEQIVDWLALIGDSADNIPGVPGVGTKTAAKLLDAYGTVEGIRANLAEIDAKRLREELEKHWDDVERNRQLVTLDRHLDVKMDWESLRRTSPQHARLLHFFEKVEFEALARELRQGDLFAS
jgi:DNA polymerase I